MGGRRKGRGEPIMNTMSHTGYLVCIINGEYRLVSCAVKGLHL